MKIIELHPTSLLVGAAVVGLAFLTMAQTPQPINPTWSPRNPQPIVLLRDYVQIYEGTPYTVPPNKILMITALGHRNSYGNVLLIVNNQPLPLVQMTVVTSLSGVTNSMAEMPRGLTVNAGDVVSVLASGGTEGVAWGFLADA